MSTVNTNFMERHVNRKLFVCAFALFGLLLGMLSYFQSSLQIDGRLLSNVNVPASWVMLNIGALLSDYGISYQTSILIIPVSVASWSALAYLLHLALKFLTRKSEI